MCNWGVLLCSTLGSALDVYDQFQLLMMTAQLYHQLIVPLFLFARFAYTILLHKEDLLFQLILGSHQSRQLLRIQMGILSILGQEQETSLPLT
jgi:hypothetical protein